MVCLMPKFRYAKPAPIKWYGYFPAAILRRKLLQRSVASPSEMGWLASKVSRYLSILCLWSHQPTAATVAGGFAAEGRKYRSMAAGAVLHAPALSRKCGQRHAVSRRWRLRTDLLQIKSNGSPYSTAERKVPEMIPVLGSQPAGDMSH